MAGQLFLERFLLPRLSPVVCGCSGTAWTGMRELHLLHRLQHYGHDHHHRRRGSMDGKLQTRVAFSIDDLQSADGSAEPNRWHPDKPQVDPAVLKHIGDTKDDAVGDLLKSAGDSGQPREGYRRQPNAWPYERGDPGTAPLRRTRASTRAAPPLRADLVRPRMPGASGAEHRPVRSTSRCSRGRCGRR
jgi:hypothetical protein